MMELRRSEMHVWMMMKNYSNCMNFYSANTGYDLIFMEHKLKVIRLHIHIG